VPEIPVSKVCSKCNTNKLATQFYIRKSGRSKGRLLSECKDCINKIRREYTPEVKSKVLQRKYGITIEQFRLMLWSQGGKCPVCQCQLTENNGKGRGQASAACVDHCHETGEIRGLLCNHCNRALGLFKDNIQTMQRAQEYIARSSNQPLLEEQIQC